MSGKKTLCISLVLFLCMVSNIPCMGEYTLSNGMSWSWANFNLNELKNGPPKSEATFTIPSPVILTYIDTYHGNNGKDMDAVGTIGLIDNDGTQYGPWDATGYPGMSLHKNAHWVALPDIQLPAGTYTVVDSDPDTWSNNAESGFAGFSGVKWKEADSGTSDQETQTDSSWIIVEDPYPSQPAEWIVKDDRITQNSNIFRTGNEYDFWLGSHIVRGDPDATDYILSFRMKAEDNDGIGAIVRYQDKENYYRFISVVDPTNRGPFTRLEKFEDGKRTVIDESRWTYEPGKEHVVAFSAIGDTLDLTVDENPVVHGKDDTFSSGKIGFLTYASDGFTVSDISVEPVKEK